LAISIALLFPDPSIYSEINKSVAPVVHEVLRIAKLLVLIPSHKLVILTVPDVAPAGTVATIVVLLSTVKDVAGILLN